MLFWEPQVKNAGILAICCSLVSGDGCTDVSSELDNNFVHGFKQQMRDSNYQYVSLDDKNVGLMGFGIKYSGLKVGDFSDFVIEHKSDDQPYPARLCVSQGLRTLYAKMRVEELGVHFDDFKLYTPYFDIGSGYTTVSIQGMKMDLYASSIVGPACTTSIKMYFDSDMSLKINLGSGLTNKLVEMVLNTWVNPFVLRQVKYWGLDSHISSFAETQLNTLFSQFPKQSVALCSILVT
uniref:Uncharacterized protein n=1 Tax=Lygus hesperus TaxID=30085 RepID=A0A146M1J2_LYGHE